MWNLKSLQTGSLIDGEFHWKEEHHSHNKSIKILILHRNEYFNPIRGGGDYFSLIGLTKGVLQTSLPPRFYKYHLFKCSYMHKKTIFKSIYPFISLMTKLCIISASLQLYLISNIMTHLVSICIQVAFKYLKNVLMLCY